MFQRNTLQDLVWAAATVILIAHDNGPGQDLHAAFESSLTDLGEFIQVLAGLLGIFPSKCKVQSLKS